jgi:hypothetical protein
MLGGHGTSSTFDVVARRDPRTSGRSSIEVRGSASQRLPKTTTEDRALWVEHVRCDLELEMDYEVVWIQIQRGRPPG